MDITPPFCGVVAGFASRARLQVCAPHQAVWMDGSSVLIGMVNMHQSGALDVWSARCSDAAIF
jgi:hypothetical protein